eukprot:1160839-Pelagomonas_calceolata.AAC.6
MSGANDSRCGFGAWFKCWHAGHLQLLEWERVGIRAELDLNKVNVPVLGRDLIRVKVGRSAWDRAHKANVRAALVPGRGASTIREKTVRNGSGNVLSDFYSLLEESLILAGIHTNKGSIPAFAGGLYAEAKSDMVPIGVQQMHCQVQTSEGNVVNGVHFAAQWAACRGGRHLESKGVLLSVPMRYLNTI